MDIGDKILEFAKYVGVYSILYLVILYLYVVVVIPHRKMAIYDRVFIFALVYFISSWYVYGWNGILGYK